MRQTPSAARALNRPAEALDFLGRIDPDHGEASRLPGYWAQRSEALHMLGRYEEQLEVAQAVRRRFPEDQRSYVYRIQGLAALDRVRELDAVLAEVLLLPSDPSWGTPALGMYVLAVDELRAHGSSAHADSVVERGIRFAEAVAGPVAALPRQRHQLAELLFRGGRLAAARGLFEKLVQDRSLAGEGIVDLRARIGMIAALQGDARTVAEIDAWLEHPGLPYLFGQNTEYRAGIQALLGHRERAVQQLRQAMAEGRSYDSGKHNYVEYRGLKGYPPFEEWLRPKG